MSRNDKLRKKFFEINDEINKMTQLNCQEKGELYMKDKEFEQILTKLIEEAKGLGSEDYLKKEIIKAATTAVIEIYKAKTILNVVVKGFPETREKMKRKFPEYFDSDDNSDDTNTYMTESEATKAAWNGKKVRRAIWVVTKPEVSYITSKGNAIVQYCKCGECCRLYAFSEEDERAKDWYIVE